MSDDEDDSYDRYGDAHFRMTPAGDRRIIIGLLAFTISDGASWSDGLTRLGIDLEEYPSRLHDDVAGAVDEVERHLSDIHKQLNNHFAPQLEWDNTKFRADLNEWQLFADDAKWSVETKKDGENVVVRAGKANGLAENRRASENMLRKLGVMFRTKRD